MMCIGPGYMMKLSLIEKSRLFLNAHKPHTRAFYSSSIKQIYTVCVEGNIACGKTTCLEYFKKFSNIVQVHQEHVSRYRNVRGHNILAKLYEDPAKWAFTFQTYVQLLMLDMHIKPQSQPIKMTERSIFSARYCFVENQHDNKIMPEIEYVVFSELFDWTIKSHNIGADLIVYLQTKPETAYKRIIARKRPEEQMISMKYLQDLHKLHEDWLIHKTRFKCPAPVLIIDANQDAKSMMQAYEEKKTEILFGLDEIS